ncbi:MAG: hypothetical protein Q9160_000785 [Pyrenula sp. 1 TL-2023]
MSNPLEDVKQLLATAEGSSRRALLRELQELIVSAETPDETATRVALYPLQTSVARVGHDLKIFETLTSSGPKSLEELQEMTKAHPNTLGLIGETDANRFEANKTCQNLATPEASTISQHFFDNGNILFQEMPDFLRKNNYEDVTDGKATVFQTALQTDLGNYAWFSQHPEYRESLIKFMAIQQAVRDRWMDEYPIERDTQGLDPNAPLFVDIGGNVGHYCAKFKKVFPTVPGRVILQDLPSTLENALQTPGVEALAHDFFEPQPIKGAKIYHLGWILHNWNDAKSKLILRQITSAMTAQSVLLINDITRPEAEVPMFVASLDLVMLCAHGSQERTMKEWTDILSDVGLICAVLA